MPCPGPKFPETFDIYLTELGPPSKDSKDPTVSGSRLIEFVEVQQLAREHDSTVGTMPLYRLRSA